MGKGVKGYFKEKKRKIRLNMANYNYQFYLLTKIKAMLI